MTDTERIDALEKTVAEHQRLIDSLGEWCLRIDPRTPKVEEKKHWTYHAQPLIDMTPPIESPRHQGTQGTIQS